MLFVGFVRPSGRAPPIFVIRNEGVFAPVAMRFFVRMLIAGYFPHATENSHNRFCCISPGTGAGRATFRPITSAIGIFMRCLFRMTVSASSH